jgi:hypothetical protein
MTEQHANDIQKTPTTGTAIYLKNGQDQPNTNIIKIIQSP